MFGKLNEDVEQKENGVVQVCAWCEGIIINSKIKSAKTSHGICIDCRDDFMGKALCDLTSKK